MCCVRRAFRVWPERKPHHFEKFGQGMELLKPFTITSRQRHRVWPKCGTAYRDRAVRSAAHSAAVLRHVAVDLAV